MLAPAVLCTQEEAGELVPRVERLLRTDPLADQRVARAVGITQIFENRYEVAGFANSDPGDAWNGDPLSRPLGVETNTQPTAA